MNPKRSVLNDSIYSQNSFSKEKNAIIFLLLSNETSSCLSLSLSPLLDPLRYKKMRRKITTKIKKTKPMQEENKNWKLPTSS